MMSMVYLYICSYVLCGKLVAWLEFGVWIGDFSQTLELYILGVLRPKLYLNLYVRSNGRLGVSGRGKTGVSSV